MNSTVPAMKIEPFSLSLNDVVLDDLRQRIRHTRWLPEVPDTGWALGTDHKYLQTLLSYWADDFDWRVQERWLNSFKHFRADIDGVPIHFVHAKARSGNGIPLILTHGWPSTFVEFLALVPLLTDPENHGISGPAFDLVIPSLPGYGFSKRPLQSSMTTRNTANVWHRLMGGLGYQHYGAHGTDFGAGVSTFMALENPTPLIGIHLGNLENSPYLGSDASPLTVAEQAFVDAGDGWFETEGGYKAIQRSKPLTLSYGLNDSPAGLAAWILEKWRSWSDTKENFDEYFSRDTLLTFLTIFWSTETVFSSMLDYVDNKDNGYALTRDDFVQVPTGIAGFTRQIVGEEAPPIEWAERMYNVQRWTPMPRGGHFPAMEEPELLAKDIAAFFASLPCHGAKREQ